MNKLPNVSQVKELPEDFIETKENPNETNLKKEKPSETDKIEIIPNNTPKKETTPNESTQKETIPDASPEKEEKPSDYIEEHCVIIGGKKIEIKPTKLKYFRNKAASGYGIIKMVPLHELLTYGKGVLDEKRDADQLLYDFLVAAFDDSTFVRDNYDELDADTIDKIVKIFGKVNHIDEKEEQSRKNKEAQAQAKR